MMSPLDLSPPAPTLDEGADPAPTPAPVGLAELAAALSAKLCHDFISPASAIVSGVDLLEDPSAQDMRDDALNLITASARKLVALLAFSRVAFGASAAAETFDARDLKTLSEGIFEHVRATLDWQVQPASVQKPVARALLNLAQLGAVALPMGGVAKLTAVEQDGAVLMSMEAEGARARLRPETLGGLKGERLADGMAGYWVQAFYLQALLAEAGGRIEASVEEGRVLLRARAPL